MMTVTLTKMMWAAVVELEGKLFFLWLWFSWRIKNYVAYSSGVIFFYKWAIWVILAELCVIANEPAERRR